MGGNCCLSVSPWVVSKRVSFDPFYVRYPLGINAFNIHKYERKYMNTSCIYVDNSISTLK